MKAILDEIAIADRPAIPGLRFRHYRGPADLPGMVAVNNTARDEAGVQESVSLESMAAQYGHLTNSDLVRDLVIVELDGRIVGYARCEWNDQHDGSRTYGSVCLIEPGLRGRGIGTAMLRWTHARRDAIAASHPADGRPRWFETACWDSDPYGTRLLERHGYQPVRRGYEMVRPDLDDLPDHPMPDGLEIRPVGRDDLRRIWEADVEAFRDHWGEIDESEEAWLRFRDDESHDPSLFVVGFDGDEVAGFVLNVIDPTDEARLGERRGLLDGVAVRRPWRRRGLARALIARSLVVLRDHGATSAMLGVDGENPNRAMTLYESCGFRIVGSTTIWRRPLPGET
jgi:mycothiol synthase